MSDFEGLGKVVADELMKRFDEADVVLTGTTYGKIRRWIGEILSPYCYVKPDGLKEGMVRTVIDLPAPPVLYERVSFRKVSPGDWFIEKYDGIWVLAAFGAGAVGEYRICLDHPAPKYKVVQNGNGVWGVERSTDHYVAVCECESWACLTRDDLTAGGDGGTPKIDWIGPGMFQEARKVQFPASVPGFKKGTWFCKNCNGYWYATGKKPCESDVHDGWKWSLKSTEISPTHSAFDTFHDPNFPVMPWRESLFQTTEDG